MSNSHKIKSTILQDNNIILDVLSKRNMICIDISNMLSCWV